MTYVSNQTVTINSPVIPTGWKRYEREFCAKATISSADVQGHYVHIVQSGWACRSKLLTNGRRQVIGVLLPGDVCGGGQGFLSRGFAICALTPCKLMVVPREEVLRATEASPVLSDAVWGEAARQDAILTELIVSLGCRSAKERISHLLRELVLRQSGRSGRSGDLPLTQTDLGEILGLSVVHVNRIMQGLRRQGLIEVHQGRLTILDVEGLDASGLFESDYLAAPAML